MRSVTNISQVRNPSGRVYVHNRMFETEQRNHNDTQVQNPMESVFVPPITEREVDFFGYLKRTLSAKAKVNAKRPRLTYGKENGPGHDKTFQ